MGGRGGASQTFSKSVPEYFEATIGGPHQRQQAVSLALKIFTIYNYNQWLSASQIFVTTIDDFICFICTKQNRCTEIVS